MAFWFPRTALPDAALDVEGRRVVLLLVRNPRARRYVLRLRPDGKVRVTVPRGGSVAEATRFAERQQEWIARQLARQVAQPPAAKVWRLGSEILFRGELQPLTLAQDDDRIVCFGAEQVRLRMVEPTTDLRPELERYLRRLAAQELPGRVQELAAHHHLKVQRVTVRNQRSRWGSCSRRATISLNWRLVQTPAFVCDYIILHELMHLREMNHSPRFWRHVELVCPDYQVAERWLKQQGVLLRS